MSTITIAGEADIEGIQRVARASWHATYAGIFAPEFMEGFLNHNYSNGRLHDSLASPLQRMFVAREEQELVGFCQVGPRDAEYHLYRIYLLPTHWGRGIGAQFLAQAEHWLKQQGVTNYSCYVHAQNEVGKAFYAKQGFVHDLALDVGDEWYMSKQL